jgi:hypothetical protein
MMMGRIGMTMIDYHHHHYYSSTPIHHHEQLPTGWKWGAMERGRITGSW